MTDLRDRMLSAHAARDRPALVHLYTEAAESAASLDASCFFLTHAYVFALETGAPETVALHARLVSHGREE